MDLHEARTVLGVAEGDRWEEVRAAYRRLMRGAHPDRAGGTDRAAARLNEAYTVLSRAKRQGPGLRAPAPPRTSPTRPPRAGPATPPPPPAVGSTIVGDDTLLVAAPPREAFGRLLEVGHRIGEVSYVDRSCGIFEVIVREGAEPGTGTGGESCSLLVTLQGRGRGSEVVLALECLERAASLSPAHYARRLAAALR